MAGTEEELLREDRQGGGNAPNALEMTRASTAGAMVAGGKSIEFEEIEVGHSCCAMTFGIICFPFTLPCSCWTLEPKQEAIVLHCGQVTDVVNNEGCHCHNICCRDILRISTTQMVVDIPKQKITDLHGSPLLVSCVLNYRFVDPKKALLNVQDPKSFVEWQASAVVKMVVGKYTYEDLKSYSDRFSEDCVQILNPMVSTAGCSIQSCTINELNYAPEISEAMLKKQQAMALIDARAMLVEGAVDIATKALQGLQDEGIEMNQQDKSKLAVDLISVFVGTTDAEN